MPNRTNIRIGNYYLTPLGLIALVVLALLIIGGAVLAVLHFTGGTDTVAPVVVEADPTEAPDVVEALPVIEPDEPAATVAPQLRSATIRSLGEIAIQQKLLFSAVDGNTYDFDEMFSMIAPVMGDADYTVGDVEGSLGGTVEYSGNTRMITPPSLIRTLKDCGVDMLNLANDHALDAGYADLQAALANCNEFGMDYVGAAASQDEKNAPVIRDIGGINVAFIAYTESLNGNEEGAVPAAVEYGVNLISKSNAKKDIETARAAGADVIVCYVSWGEMFNPALTNNQKRIAKALNEWGVDVIIGCNPHVIQPAAWIESTDADGVVRRTLCLGATGNFLSDQYGEHDNGLIFQFTIQETEYGHFAITNPVYIPTFVWRSEREDGKYDYHTLAIGQWLDTEPEGMAYADVSRMKQLWAEIQDTMGDSVATVAEQ